jgi:hypothetical protein
MPVLRSLHIICSGFEVVGPLAVPLLACCHCTAQFAAV